MATFAPSYRWARSNESYKRWQSFLEGIHGVGLHIKSDWSSCVKNVKKRSWERSSNPAYCQTSAHLANHCVKWEWLSDCLFRKGTKIVECSSPFFQWRKESLKGMSLFTVFSYDQNQNSDLTQYILFEDWHNPSVSMFRVSAYFTNSWLFVYHLWRGSWLKFAQSLMICPFGVNPAVELRCFLEAASCQHKYPKNKPYSYRIEWQIQQQNQWTVWTRGRRTVQANQGLCNS